MMKKTILILVVIMLLAACTPDPNEQFIQGTWEFANEFENERSGAAHLLQFWRFSNGFFFFTQEIVLGMPQVLEGRYAVLESNGDELILELYMIEGNMPFSDPQELTIVIDREAGSARINRILYQKPEE